MKTVQSIFQLKSKRFLVRVKFKEDIIKGYSFCKRAKIEIVLITWLIQNYICGTQFSICLISYNWEILCLQYQMLKVISIGMDLKMLYGGYIFAFVSTKVLLLLFLFLFIYLFFFFGFSFHIRTMLWNFIKFSSSGKKVKQNKIKIKPKLQWENIYCI